MNGLSAGSCLTALSINASSIGTTEVVTTVMALTI